LIPTAGFAIIKALKTRVPALSSILSDPILVFVLLLETAMPSAQNSTVILQLQKKSAAAARVARILLAIYVLGVPAISYWLIKILKYSNL
jgi:predicted permease